jgi:hypothetical protein
MGPLVGDDAAFEHEGEGVEGWPPADGPSLPALAGRVERPQREVEALEGGLVGRDVPVGPDRSTESAISARTRSVMLEIVSRDTSAP